jgi:hypothetical protein
MERIYRDPVHNIIPLSEERADDALLVALIDTPEFQRLRRIRQLGLALFTYQGAEHSRFTHAIGVMHVMTRILSQLGAKYPISAEAQLVARTAALLHDLGHGPFSHVIEKALHQHHEGWTTRIIADVATGVHQCLAQYDAALPDKVMAALENRYRPAFVSQLVSSQLDADRLDYLLRDSLMTGVKYGNYDLEWILHSLEIDEIQGRVYLAANGLYAVEEYLQARYYMFRQVYFHRTLRSAENVLLVILRRAVDLARAGHLQFLIPGTGIERVLTGVEMTTAEYLKFDDHEVMFHIGQWQYETDSILSDLAQRFINRRLFKVLEVSLTEEERPAFVTRAREAVRACGYNPDYYLIEDKAADIPYYGYYRAEGKSRIMIERSAGGELCDIADVSNAVRSMRGYEIYRICFPAEAAESITRLAQQASR